MTSPFFRRAAWTSVALALAAFGAAPHLGAERTEPRGLEQAPPQTGAADPFLGGLTYRHLSVFTRGGRVTAVAGVPSDTQRYYMGSTGGGVWRTTDAGTTWTNVSDGFFEAGAIGAVAVSESNPNVVFAGTGSACPRGNISTGVGIYKSSDGGATWQHVGLPNAGTIGRIVIHPTNPDLVYAAVLGNLFGPNEERGVYRTSDGGKTWQLVHKISSRTGAVELSMDMKNPNIVFAGMWTTERKPWSIDSGSTEGGLFRTTDGGNTWQKLTAGLPSKVMVGKIGVSVSRANPQRVYAQIEAANDEGGTFRSDDGGNTWTRTFTGRNLQQRAWYYTHIYADPVDADTVYAQNVAFFKSTDGGKTFQTVPGTGHSDHHDIWINPRDNKMIIEGNDGGANITVAGSSGPWSTLNNQPTSEIYRLSTDTRFPYWVYGAQQDNSTVAVPSQGNEATYGVGGGESGHIAVDPRDYNIIYAGNYGGSITRTDRKFGTSEQVRVYADSQTGQRAADMKYRFQWNAPIRISPHTPDVVYTTSQVVHRTTNNGLDWTVVSPDLTRNDKRRQNYSGGEGITRDNTGVEVYSTIFSFEESPYTPGLIWAGSDDGLVHISRDNSKTWRNVTPKDWPEGCINIIDISAHSPGRAHVAMYRYRQNDFTPYIYQTNDYGVTWKRIADGKNGIPARHFVRVVREDPARRGLLYAGTEFGIYASFDDGATWQSIQANLPRTPVTDIKIYRDDLILTTQGRGFYIVDNLSVLRSIQPGQTQPAARLFKPEDGYREGAQPPTFYYWFRETPTAPVIVSVKDAKGTEVFTTTSQPGTASPPVPAAGGGRGGRGGRGGGDAEPAEGGEEAPAAGRGRAGAAGAAAGTPPGRGQGAAAGGAPPAAGAAAQPPQAGAAGQAPPAGQRGGGAGGGGGRGRGAGAGGGGGAAPSAGAVQGLNRAVWTNMRLASPFTVPQGIVMWGGGGGQGPKLAPGTYSVTVSSGPWTETQTFRLGADPRANPPMTDAEGAEQLRLASEIGGSIKELYDNLARIRDAKRQASAAAEKSPDGSPVRAATRTLTDKLVAVESDMTQIQGEGGQDALNFPGRLDNQLVVLYGAIVAPERRLGSPVLERYKDLKPQIDQTLTRARAALKTDVAAFNTVATAAGAAAIVVK